MYVARVRSGVYGKSGISDMHLALVGNETRHKLDRWLGQTRTNRPTFTLRFDIWLDESRVISMPNRQSKTKGIGKQSERTNQGTNRAVANRFRCSEVNR